MITLLYSYNNQRKLTANKNNISTLIQRQHKTRTIKALLSPIILVLDGFLFIPFSADIVYITSTRTRRSIIRNYIAYIILTTIGCLIGFKIGASYSSEITPLLTEKLNIDINQYIKNKYYLATLLLLKSIVPIPVVLANIIHGIAGTNILTFITLSIIMRTIRFTWLNKTIQIATSNYYKIAKKAFASFTALSVIGALDIVYKLIST